MLFSPLMIQACLLRWSSRKIFQEREKKIRNTNFCCDVPYIIIAFHYSFFFFPLNCKNFRVGGLELATPPFTASPPIFLRVGQIRHAQLLKLGQSHAMNLRIRTFPHSLCPRNIIDVYCLSMYLKLDIF